MNRKSASKRRSKRRRRPGFWTDFNDIFVDALAMVDPVMGTVDAEGRAEAKKVVEAFKRELRAEIKSGDFARELAIGLADEVRRLKGLLKASKARATPRSARVSATTAGASAPSCRRRSSKAGLRGATSIRPRKRSSSLKI